MINFANISKKFGDKVVLDEICLRIPKSKITFIVGRSGQVGYHQTHHWLATSR